MRWQVRNVSQKHLDQVLSQLKVRTKVTKVRKPHTTRLQSTRKIPFMQKKKKKIAVVSL